MRTAYICRMKMTVTQFVSGKDINRRVLQRNIKAALQGDKKVKQKLFTKYGITAIESVSSRLYMLNVKK